MPWADAFRRLNGNDIADASGIEMRFQRSVEWRVAKNEAEDDMAAKFVGDVRELIDFLRRTCGGFLKE